MTDHVLDPTNIKLNIADILKAGGPSHDAVAQLPEGATFPSVPMGVVTHVILPNGQLIELPQPFFVEVEMTVAAAPDEATSADGGDPPALEIVQ